MQLIVIEDSAYFIQGTFSSTQRTARERKGKVVGDSSRISRHVHDQQFKKWPRFHEIKQQRKDLHLNRSRKRRQCSSWELQYVMFFHQELHTYREQVHWAVALAPWRVGMNSVLGSCSVQPGTPESHLKKSILTNQVVKKSLHPWNPLPWLKKEKPEKRLQANVDF